MGCAFAVLYPSPVFKYIFCCFRRQVKVILMDVLQTEEGQKYLSSYGSDTNAKTQSTLKIVPRERESERGPSTEHSIVRRRASAPCKDQTKFSSLKPTNSPSSKMTNSLCTEENNMHLSKEVQSPVARRCKRFKNSLKQAERTASDEEESCSLKESDSSPRKGSHNLLPKHTESPDAGENELCPVEESDSPSVSPLHSEEADSEHIFESFISATHTPSQVRLSSGFYRTEYQDSESEAVPTQVRFPNNV